MLAQRLVEIARREVGVRETGKNSSPRIVEYQKATWLQPGPWAWCAAFTCWCLREMLSTPGAKEALGLSSPSQVLRWRCRDAKAFGWLDWGRKRPHLQVLGENEPARAGDFVVFDFSHIGIVSIGGRQGQRLETIEGNTNLKGSREGDGVYCKSRLHDPDSIKGFVRVLDPTPRVVIS